MNRRPRLLLATALVLALVAGCTGTTPSTSPSQPAATASASTPASESAVASPPGGEAPTSPEGAAALVIAQNQDFLGFNERDDDMIGQCCWWTAERAEDGYRVTVHAGWGDCPSGCIEQHEWIYDVSATGQVTLVDESGDPVPAGGIPTGGM